MAVSAKRDVSQRAEEFQQKVVINSVVVWPCTGPAVTPRLLVFVGAVVPQKRENRRLPSSSCWEIRTRATAECVEPRFVI